MATITLHPTPGAMALGIRDIPAFPGEGFGAGWPESIGDAARAVWFGNITPERRDLGDGAWEQTGKRDGEVSYRITFTATEDTVDVQQSVTNLSDRVWEQSLAFNCFQCGSAPSIQDHECLRHYVGLDGEPRRLIEIPRQFGPRPTVQLYSVEGQPLGRDIPFVAGFAATPDVVLEGWFAIVSRDGKRLVATVSKPTLFLFQNMEYSCIHAAAGFGRLAPGETGEAESRLYFVESSLVDWHARVRDEMVAARQVP